MCDADLPWIQNLQFASEMFCTSFGMSPLSCPLNLRSLCEMPLWNVILTSRLVITNCTQRLTLRYARRLCLVVDSGSANLQQTLTLWNIAHAGQSAAMLTELRMSGESKFPTCTHLWKRCNARARCLASSAGDKLWTFKVGDDDKMFVEFDGSTTRSTSFVRQDHCLRAALSCLLTA